MSTTHRSSTSVIAPINAHSPPFPEPGSILHNRYFCIGRLGRGTFCSIHKCIDLSYFHRDRDRETKKCHVTGGENEEEKEDVENRKRRSSHGPHETNNNNSNSNGHKKKRKTKKSRLVAVKVELTQFSNSGVVDGEAGILQHLSSQKMTAPVVPVYHEHLTIPNSNNASSSSSSSSENNKQGTTTTTPTNNGVVGAEGGTLSAIVMECLPGEDMHQLRERMRASYHNGHHSSSRSSSGFSSSLSLSSRKCRVNLADAVYLVADCMLPLLKAMHTVGILHRDVKPNNCVRVGTTNDDRSFKMVDFGLSKSFVVPAGSSGASSTVWKGPWQGQSSPSHSQNNGNGNGHGNNNGNVEGRLRTERPTAEFRGTSMYASLRVHQSRDYGRRDDLWGLLYVACDLVSGGLPWMVQASERDRSSCAAIKERVHGERDNDGNQPLGVHSLLEGPNRENPLALSRCPRRVQALERAFRHLASLGFADEPNYALIEECLRELGPDPERDDPDVTRENDEVVRIAWTMPPPVQRVVTNSTYVSHTTATWMERNWVTSSSSANHDEDDGADPVTEAFLEEAEQTMPNTTNNNNNNNNGGGGGNGGGDTHHNGKPSSSTQNPFPLVLQFQLAQAEYNAAAAASDDTDTLVPPDKAVEDWLRLGLTLVDHPWNAMNETTANATANGRSGSKDTYRRERLVHTLRRCLACAPSPLRMATVVGRDRPPRPGVTPRQRLSALSAVRLRLVGLLDREESKPCAPPPDISFSEISTSNTL